jgi:hypothetical protein
VPLADHHLGDRVDHRGELLLRRGHDARVLALGASTRLDERQHDPVRRRDAVQHLAVILFQPRPERRIVEIERAARSGAEPRGIVREPVKRVVPQDDLADPCRVRRVDETVHQRELAIVADLVEVHHHLVRELQVIYPVRRGGGDDSEVVGLAVGEDGPTTDRLVDAKGTVGR